MPTTGKDVFSSCLWTGCAAFSTDNTQLDMSIKYSPNGQIVPAMPDDLLVGRDTVVEGIRYTLRNCRKYYERSEVKRYDVRNIPLKIDTKKFPHLAHIVDHDKNTTKIVHPVKLIELNIGSNHGLISILRQMYEAEGMHNRTCARYHVLNVDENIYWRTMKVTIGFGVFVFFSPRKDF